MNDIFSLEIGDVMEFGRGEGLFHKLLGGWDIWRWKVGDRYVVNDIWLGYPVFKSIGTVRMDFDTEYSMTNEFFIKLLSKKVINIIDPFIMNKEKVNK